MPGKPIKGTPVKAYKPAVRHPLQDVVLVYERDDRAVHVEMLNHDTTDPDGVKGRFVEAVNIPVRMGASAVKEIKAEACEGAVDITVTLIDDLQISVILDIPKMMAHVKEVRHALTNKG